MKIFIAMTLAAYLSGNFLFAGESLLVEASMHIAYGDFSTVFVITSVSINYEYLPAKFISIRGGLASGYETGF